MTRGEGSAASVYDFWLGLLPQFLAQFGALAPNAPAADGAAALPFPVDQIAKAATLTQQALQGLAQAYGPLLQTAGAPGLLGQWAAAMSSPPGMAQAGTDKRSRNSAAMPAAGALPFLSTASAMATPETMLTATMLPFQQLQQAWLDLGRQLGGTSAHEYTAAFDRMYGGLSDALGFGPMRKLQAAAQELVAASAAQNDARARYAFLVQGAFTAGLDKVLQRLADMAQKGERVDSILALIRLWAVCTEEAVHDVLQSPKGVEATAATIRAGLAYRREMQRVSGIIADALDLATRRDLDEAYREIQALKREVRARRAPQAAPPTPTKAAPRRRKGKST